MKKYAVGKNGKFSIDYDGTLSVYRSENGNVYKRTLDRSGLFAEEVLFGYGDEVIKLNDTDTLVRLKNKLVII